MSSVPLKAFWLSWSLLNVFGSSEKLSTVLELHCLPIHSNDMMACVVGSHVTPFHVEQSVVLDHVGSMQFQSFVNAMRLPPRLQTLDLDDNEFSGTIEWNFLPPRLQYFYLRGNQFRGDIDFSFFTVRVARISFRTEFV
eukprot:PhF_6_TR6920/c0_g1_i3/m.10090